MKKRRNKRDKVYLVVHFSGQNSFLCAYPFLEFSLFIAFLIQGKETVSPVFPFYLKLELERLPCL